MRGLHLEAGTLTFRTDLPTPTPAANWSRVRVVQAGICATDQALARGYMGFRGIPGHEFVGVAIDGPLAGRRVVGEINAGCGQCASCREGDDRHCPHRSVLGILRHGGAFAEELLLPDRNLLPVPDTVSDDAATFTEPLAAALHLLDDLEPRHRRILVAGDGKLGLLCAFALARHGLDVTLAGRHPERAALLPFAIRHVIGWLEDEAPPTVEPFDAAVEATGQPQVLPRLLQLVRPRGTVLLKTTVERPAALDLSLAVVNELRLVGSRCGLFAPALAALAEGTLPAAGLITARYPLSAGVAAFARANQRGSLKVLLQNR